MAGNTTNPAESRYERLVRNLYRSGGYVFAAKAGDIARQHGIARVARLASNENPWPPSPAAVREGCEALQGANRYPDESVAALTGMLARFHGGYSFVTGVGMDGVIETMIRTLVDPGDRVAVSVPTFSFYRLAALAQAADVAEIPRAQDFSVSTREFIGIARDAKISFLCTPNNPTGTVTPADDVREILSAISGILFLDNAYVEFSGVDYRPLMDEFDNLVIGRTMSKAFALAGARVGYAFVPGWLVPFYNRAATPFTLNTISARVAAGALGDREGMEEYVSYVRRWRERFREECPLPSSSSGANFVMFDTSPLTGDEMVRLLAGKGVIVRSCASFPGLPDHYIRVSIGDSWENELFLAAMEEICRPRA
ncbi:MAG: histidinol-phosphate transaminase [Methanomicrobiales archaeon]|nr:histidinol-phosphate transaminase [Methanomicrobiales archaeon]NYT20182.1 histidinol-phosphate transaminase [Methanomicrobiales archaeon]